jgi:hypothetical protein
LLKARDVIAYLIVDVILTDILQMTKGTAGACCEAGDLRCLPCLGCALLTRPHSVALRAIVWHRIDMTHSAKARAPIWRWDEA